MINKFADRTYLEYKNNNSHFSLHGYLNQQFKVKGLYTLITTIFQITQKLFSFKVYMQMLSHTIELST